ncbi:MAG: hypothetical protein UC708_06565 [Anaerovoracaceae bacterium]|nr:hypothetical protein [Anaerovoracaceae bacterium]
MIKKTKAGKKNETEQFKKAHLEFMEDGGIMVLPLESAQVSR